MNNTQIVIQKLEEIDKIYVYRSRNANDINTITKISKLQPIIIIDQSIFQTSLINGQECFIIKDEPSNIAGFIYNGPEINNIPVIEYETKVNTIFINGFSFVLELTLSPLELNQINGIMYYYSIIGIKEDTQEITHLSKINGALVEFIDKKDLIRELWSCEEYTGTDNDIWNPVSDIPYSEITEEIKIGNVNHQNEIQQLGIPVVNTVPQIEEINVSLNSLISNTFMTLSIQNPWQDNNKKFNYRKLKSYKIRYIHDSLYGQFSMPTYQSEIPVSIEKMIVMYKENPDDNDKAININDSDAQKIEIIRRNGIFYNKLNHKSLGYNQWTIPLETNKLSVYSESSINDIINIQISATAGNLYVFDVYLVDIYENISNNTHYIIHT